MNDAPPAIRTVWSRLTSGASVANVRRALVETDVGDALSSSFHIADHVLIIDFTERLAEARSALAQLGALSLSLAPEIVAEHVEGARSVMCARYRACSGEAVVPLKGAGVSPPPEARARFLGDVERLLDAGWSHPYLDRGYAHWRCGARSGTLVIDTWEAVQVADGSARAEILRDVERMVGRIR